MKKVVNIDPVIGCGSLNNYTKEDFMNEILEVRKMLSNKKEFFKNYDHAIKHLGLMLLCCEDEEVRNTIHSTLYEIETRHKMIMEFGLI